MEDKCFCHLNGFRVKDAEARNRIEVLEEKIENIDIPEGEGGTGDTGYHVLNLPLGSPVTQIPFGELTFDLSSECLPTLEEFINKLYNSEIKKPIVKIVNTTYSNGEYSMPLEINYTNTSTEITHEQPTFLFFGSTLQLENMLWRSKLAVNGTWTETDGKYIYTITSASIKLIEESESADVDLTGYATEEYVNNAIANIDIPEGGATDLPVKMYTLNLKFGLNYLAVSRNNVSISNSNDCKGQMTTMIPQMMDDIKNGYGVQLVICEPYSSSSQAGYRAVLTHRGLTTEIGSHTQSFVGTYCTDNDRSPRIIILDVPGSISYEGVYTCSDVKLTIYDLWEEVLRKSNTKSFTPTANYHPATKKYVDDALASLSGGGCSIYDLTLTSINLSWENGLNSFTLSGNDKTAVTNMMAEFGNQPTSFKPIHLISGGAHFILNYLGMYGGSNNKYYFEGLSIGISSETGETHHYEKITMLVEGYHSGTTFNHSKTTISREDLNFATKEYVNNLTTPNTSTSGNLTLQSGSGSATFSKQYVGKTNLINTVCTIPANTTSTFTWVSTNGPQVNEPCYSDNGVLSISMENNTSDTIKLTVVATNNTSEEKTYKGQITYIQK